MEHLIARFFKESIKTIKPKQITTLDKYKQIFKPTIPSKTNATHTRCKKGSHNKS